jgi:hypothetical protein
MVSAAKVASGMITNVVYSELAEATAAATIGAIVESVIVAPFCVIVQTRFLRPLLPVPTVFLSLNSILAQGDVLSVGPVSVEIGEAGDSGYLTSPTGSSVAVENLQLIFLSLFKIKVRFSSGIIVAKSLI